MRRILAVGNPTVVTKEVARTLGLASKPARARKERNANPLSVIPTKVVYAPGIVDKDALTVEAGGVTGRMLAKRARDAEIAWRQSLKERGL